MVTLPNVARGPMPGEISDHLLLDRYLSSRSPEPFLELVKRHTALVYGTCLRITANPHDAEELTQECFFELARQAGNIRTSLVGWLHHAARHRALNRLRGERRRKVHERDAGLERNAVHAPEPSPEPSWNEIAPQVDQAIAELPESLRVPLLMYYLEGVTQEDIANTLGLHQSTVSRRLSDGVNSLRDALRRAGSAIPLAALATWLTSQSAVAAPPALAASLSKIGLAGVGTSLSATAAGSSQVAGLAGTLKGVFAFFSVPIAAGVVWGEVVFLLTLAAWCSYIGWYRPKWFRVLCYTRQVPNIYESPFFPFARWTWQSPPPEWRIFTAGCLVTGFQLLGLAVLAPLFDGLRISRLLLAAPGLWQVFMGLRIWRRARICRRNNAEPLPETESPVDGALLLTYTLIGSLLLAKLGVSPWFLSQPNLAPGAAGLLICCLIFWATILVCGSVLVLGRFRRWRDQGPIDPGHVRQIADLAPPRWLLGALLILPLTVATGLTVMALVRDVYPVYVPFDDEPLAIVRRQIFALTLLAMDFTVLAILPLAYLYRRIPRIVWGVGCGVLGLIFAFHLGTFTRNLIAAPVLASPTVEAPRPRLALLPGHFLVENLDDLPARPTAASASPYMGTHRNLSVRLTAAAAISLEFPGHAARMSLPERPDGRESEVSVSIFVLPKEFERGIPRQMQVVLILVGHSRRQQQVQEFLLPLPEQLSPEEWKAQWDFAWQPPEKNHPLDGTIPLGTIQGSPVTLSVVSLPPEPEVAPSK